MLLRRRRASYILIALSLFAAAAPYASDANARPGSSLAYAIDETTDGGVIRLTSTAGFARDGGSAVIDPDTPAEEVVTYDGIDTITNDLFGVVRGPRPSAHASGARIEALRGRAGEPFAPAADPPQPGPESDEEPWVPPHGHHHQAAATQSGDTGGEVIAPPTYSWLSDHCTMDGPHSIRLVYVYDSVNDPTTADDQRVTDPISKMREEIQAADRGISQSHDTFKQHLKIKCRRDTYAVAWSDIDIASYAPPVSTSTVPGENNDADKNNNGYLECGEVLGYMTDVSPYGRSAGVNRRHIFYLDQSLAGDDCSFGSPDVHPGDARWDDPGTSNIANTTYASVIIDYLQWSATGVSNRSVMVTLHELHHSLGAVAYTAPSNCCISRKGHTSDHPDYMNGGYCNPLQTQPDCYPYEDREVTRNCVSTLPASLTYRNSYVDCGRDDYWAPNAGSGSWLCSHYNVAWDSLYYHQRASVTPGCR
jgi:hypothetical protein